MTPVRSRYAALTSLLPGGLLGAHLTGLLFFLNPNLPLTWSRVGGGLAVSVLAGALLGAALFGPWTLWQPRRVLRALPWASSAVLAFVALLLAFHASFYAYLLPPGVNTRLLKAAAVLGLAALASFYTALLHTLADRRYGVRSQLFLWLMAVGSLYVMVERREAYQPRPDSTLASAVEEPRPVNLLLVSLEGASLEVILPLSEQGQLPFLAETLRVGSFARLETLRPLRRQAALTSLVTGKWPFKHGIRDETIYRAPALGSGSELFLLPGGAGRMPWLVGAAPAGAVQPEDRQASTAWEITQRLGLGSGTTGWPLAVRSRSDLLFSDTAEEPDAPLTIDSGSLAVSPWVSALDPSIRALTENPMRRDQEFASRFRIRAGEAPSARAVYLHLPGLAQASRETFGAYLLSPFEGTGEGEFSAAARGLTTYYRWLDSVLAELWSSTTQPAVLVVLSTHGYRGSPWWRHRGRTERRRQGIAGAESDGMMLLRGEGIRASSYVAEATLVDVVPTVLYALGLPIARDLDGRPLTGVLEPEELASRPLSFLPSYEALLGQRAAPGSLPRDDP